MFTGQIVQRLDVSAVMNGASFASICQAGGAVHGYRVLVPPVQVSAGNKCHS